MMRWDCKDVDREAIIHELMLEAGLTDAPGLADSLKAVKSFASMPAPVPGTALAAMLAGAAAAGGPIDELGKRRRLRQHRPVVIGAAVLTAMGLGIGGVAASSSGFSKGTPEFMQSLISGWAPGWTTAPPSLVPAAPAGDSPKVTTHPAPVDLPAPAVAPEPAFATAPGAAVPPAVEHPADPVEASPADPAEAKDSPKQGQSGRAGAQKTARPQPKPDPQGVPKPTADTLAKWSGKELQDGLQQVLQDGKADLTDTSQGESLRLLFGLGH